MMPTLQIKQAAPDFNSYTTGGAVAGAASGAALAALLSYYVYRKDKKQSTWKKIIKGLGWAALGGAAGGAAGAYLGRMYYRHKMYNHMISKIREEMDNDPDGKRTGRVLYADCVDNVYDPGKGTFLKNLFPDGAPVGHAVLITIDDKSGAVRMLSPASKGDPFDVPILESKIIYPSLGIEARDDNEIASSIATALNSFGYGGRVRLYEGASGIDLRLPEKFMQMSKELAESSGGGGYSPMFGGWNCATLTREAWDACQQSQASHWLDMLLGGGSTKNAPSLSADRSWMGFSLPIPGRDV